MIRKIFQDREGFIWLATDNGLSRYDGRRFMNFLPKDGDTLSLSNREVTSIAQTRDGYIWVGTKDGLNRLDPKTGLFRQYRLNKTPFIRHSYVRALLADSHGYLWIAFANGTTTRLNTTSFRYNHFYSQGGANSDYFQHFIFEKNNGNILIGGYNFPLREYSYKTDQTTLVPDSRCTVHGRLGCLGAAYQDKGGNLWLANVASWGLIYNPRTQRYTELPELGGLYAIAGDSKGNIWLGGYWPWLCRYNIAQNKVTYYEHSSSLPYSRVGQQTFSIHCDRSGVVWIGTDAGLSRYSPYKNKFPLYRHIPDEAASPISNSINAIFQDSDGDLWFGTNDAGAFSLNLSVSRLRHFKYEPSNPNTISSKTVTGIGQDNQGTLWFSLWDGSGSALNSLNKATGIVKRHKTCDDYYWNNDIEVKNNRIVVGSWGMGLEYYNKRKNDYFDIIRGGSKGFKRDLNGSRCLEADGNGNLWFSSSMLFNSYCTNKKEFTSYFINSSNFNKVTRIMAKRFNAKNLNLSIESGSEHYFRDCKGVAWNIRESSIVELNKKENRFKSYPISGKAKPTSISNSYKGNGLWLGGETGLIYFSFTTNTSVEYKANIPLGSIATTAEISENRLMVGSSSGLYIGDVKKNGSTINFKKISSTPFSTSCRLTNGNLLVGSSMGLYLLNSSNNSLTKVIDEGGSNVIHSMHTLNGRDVYIGTDNGLMHYQQGKGITKWWKPNGYERNQLIDDQVYSVTQTPDGTVWLATNRGYAKLNPDNRTFTHFHNEAKDALTCYLVSKVFTDSRGNTWVGTTDNNGLNRIDGKTGSIDNYWNFLYDSTSIAKGTVNDIFEAHDGTIWVATDGGLCQYLPKTNNFRRYNERNGLGSSTVYAIQEDHKGNLWVSTLAGITRFDPQTLKHTSYTWKDGLQDGQFSRKCAAKLNDGRLAFGGNEGYNMFYPDSIRSNPTAPLPMITSVVVNGKVRYLSTPAKLTLSYDEHNIELSLSCSDYSFPENNQLEYKLEGFDKLYRRAAVGHTAVYTNLPSGSYRFILRASNNDGEWSQSPLVVDIEVSYPIWLKWWAILIVVGGLLGLIFAAFKIWMWKITKQKLMLEKKVAQQTEKLRLKSEEIATQNNLLATQNEHIQTLYNQLSNDIEYANFIQQSIQLKESEINTILGASFLISQPKDTLSGDFFWAKKQDNEVKFVVGGSRLHSVSGSIMGMVGILLVKQLANSSESNSPNMALKELNRQIRSFSVESDRHRQLLGKVEVGFCILNRVLAKVSYSGRHINLYISRDVNGLRQTTECKGLHPLTKDINHQEEYPLIEVEVKAGDYLYLFTDGLGNLLNMLAEEHDNMPTLHQLITTIASHPFEMQESAILEKIYEWKGKATQKGDITVVGILV
jgi:Serine phosphatase RsbU, regulator of sigma subunit